MAHVREEIALGAIGGLGRELGIERRLLGELAVGHELHGSCDPGRFAGGVALGEGPKAHPFVMSRLVTEADFRVAEGAQGEMIGEHFFRPLDVLGMHERPKPIARMAELARLEAQQFLEVRPEPERIGGEVELQHTVAGAEHGAGQALLGGGECGLGALAVGHVDERAGDAQHLAAGAMRHIGLLRDPAFAAVRQAHAVLAGVGGMVRVGLEGRAPHALQVLGMHAREAAIQVVQLRGGRDGEHLVQVVGGDPAPAVEVQVHGRDARRALRDVERLGFLAERGLEVLALGDVGDRADEPHRHALGIVRDLTARREPADAPVLEERAVLRLEVRAALERVAQGMDDGFEVHGVDGREPIVAGEGRAQGLDPDELEEERGRVDLGGLQIELEDAEAADVLHEAQEFGGALQLRLADLAAVDEIVQGFGERIELIAAALGGGLGVPEVDELFAQPRDPRGEMVRERPPDGREHDEHVEGDQAQRDAVIRAHGREPRGRPDDDCGRHREGEQLGANRPTAHASSKGWACALYGPGYRPFSGLLEL